MSQLLVLFCLNLWIVFHFMGVAQLSIRLHIEGHLSCFQRLAIVNKRAVNICVGISLWM